MKLSELKTLIAEIETTADQCGILNFDPEVLLMTEFNNGERIEFVYAPVFGKDDEIWLIAPTSPTR